MEFQDGVLKDIRVRGELGRKKIHMMSRLLTYTLRWPKVPIPGETGLKKISGPC